jgi:hypothetical protein
MTKMSDAGETRERSSRAQGDVRTRFAGAFGRTFTD